jgi:hypothetical protein
METRLEKQTLMVLDHLHTYTQSTWLLPFVSDFLTLMQANVTVISLMQQARACTT